MIWTVFWLVALGLAISVVIAAWLDDQDRARGGVTEADIYAARAIARLRRYGAGDIPAAWGDAEATVEIPHALIEAARGYYVVEDYRRN